MRKLLLLSAITLLVGCGENNDDKVKAPDREGSIETQLYVEHVNASVDVLRTTHKIWVKNREVYQFVTYDTIPSLGKTQVDGEDDDGNTKSFMVNKDYEIYITVSPKK